jgi:hypothetical protein
MDNIVKRGFILTEIGNLQIFTWQTEYEHYHRLEAAALYCKKSDQPLTFGPFTTVWEAVSFFTNHSQMKLIQQAKENALLNANLIVVDFKAKKRIT